MKKSAAWDVQTTYNGDGDDKVEYFIFEKDTINDSVGKVKINDTQYFDNVPFDTYNFYIGGYQPLQKWLKDRKMTQLNFESIRHYEEMIHAIAETMRLTELIDDIYNSAN